jgi:two-component system NtrC family sensor kinase
MSKERILIIDDSTELRSLLESILPYSGYETIGATTGQEGLKLALELRPDAILVDLELPDTSGLQVLEALHQHKVIIPTIMMTGYGSEGVAARALRLGALGYLIKPFTTEEVLLSIERALTVRRLTRENAHLTTRLETYARHFRMLHAIGRAMITSPDLDQFFRQLAEAGLYATRAERCLLLLLDARPDQLRVAAAIGKSCPAGRHIPTQACDEHLRPVLKDGTSVRLHAPQESVIGLQSGDAVKAVLQVPLRTGGRTVGLLSVDRQDTNTPFGRHDEQILTLLADYAVIALEENSQVEALTVATPSTQDNPTEPSTGYAPC